ncbi:hypothetical protein AAY473_003988 [Plecturocebus cupreus]
MGFHHVGKAGLKLLISGDLPHSASQSTGITAWQLGKMCWCRVCLWRDPLATSPAVGCSLLTQQHVVLGTLPTGHLVTDQVTQGLLLRGSCCTFPTPHQRF